MVTVHVRNPMRDGFFFFSSGRRHTRFSRDWSSDVCSSDLFAVMLAVATVVYALTGLGGAFDRELLGVFDALLVVVLGLVLYGMSARDPSMPPGWMDRFQLVAVVSALVLDVMVLGAMVARIGELGFTPNRTVALGLNLVLLVNLAG